MKQQNFVAKHSRKINRPSVEPCGKLYNRKPKHKIKEKDNE